MSNEEGIDSKRDALFGHIVLQQDEHVEEKRKQLNEYSEADKRVHVSEGRIRFATLTRMKN